jgi:hypothetical protein
MENNSKKSRKDQIKKAAGVMRSPAAFVKKPWVSGLAVHPWFFLRSLCTELSTLLGHGQTA